MNTKLTYFRPIVKGLKKPYSPAEKQKVSMITSNNSPNMSAGKADYKGPTCPKCGHNHDGSICSFNKSILDVLFKAAVLQGAASGKPKSKFKGGMGKEYKKLSSGIPGHKGGNPYHDEAGRFTTKDRAVSRTTSAGEGAEPTKGAPKTAGSGRGSDNKQQEKEQKKDPDQESKDDADLMIDMMAEQRGLAPPSGRSREEVRRLVAERQQQQTSAEKERDRRRAIYERKQKEKEAAKKPVSEEKTGMGMEAPSYEGGGLDPERAKQLIAENKKIDSDKTGELPADYDPVKVAQEIDQEQAAKEKQTAAGGSAKDIMQELFGPKHGVGKVPSPQEQQRANRLFQQTYKDSIAQGKTPIEANKDAMRAVKDIKPKEFQGPQDPRSPFEKWSEGDIGTKTFGEEMDPDKKRQQAVAQAMQGRGAGDEGAFDLQAFLARNERAKQAAGQQSMSDSQIRQKEAYQEAQQQAKPPEAEPGFPLPKEQQMPQMGDKVIGSPPPAQPLAQGTQPGVEPSPVDPTKTMVEDVNAAQMNAKLDQEAAAQQAQQQKEQDKTIIEDLPAGAAQGVIDRQQTKEDKGDKGEKSPKEPKEPRPEKYTTGSKGPAVSLPFSQYYGAGSAVGAGTEAGGGAAVAPAGSFMAQRAHGLLNADLNPHRQHTFTASPMPKTATPSGSPPEKRAYKSIFDTLGMI